MIGASDIHLISFCGLCYGMKHLGANVKFNNGNFTALRTLYTLGIQSMAKLEHSLRPKEAEMLSNMHSNCAVTFFEK